MREGETGQRFLGLVFVFRHDDRQVRPLVVLEAERCAADDLVAGDGRADPFLDVLDDQVRPREVANVGRSGRVVHRVRHIAHQHRVLAVASHLPQAERAAEHAHVGVDAEEHHILDAPIFHHAPDLLAAVADDVSVVDFQDVDLGFPGSSRIAPKDSNLAAH